MRILVLTIVLSALGFGIRQAFGTSNSFSPVSVQNLAPPPSLVPETRNVVSPVNRSHPSARPSFNCAKARTRVELLVCQDINLAALDVELDLSYKRALADTAPTVRSGFLQEHLSWFKQFSRACNEDSTDSERPTCVANQLSARIAELKRRAN